MIFTTGRYYVSRAGTRYRCIEGWGPLPKFIDDDGVTIVQAPDGRYRFDRVDHVRDIVAEEPLSNLLLDHPKT